MNNNDFISFLYEKKLEGLKPQIIYVTRDPYMVWFPANKEKKALYQPKNVCLVGYTGRCYLNYNKTQQSQPYQICWAGIDIDDYNDAEKIHNLIPEATIRASKSGKGLHLFFRFEKVLIEAGIKGCVVKKSLKPFIKRLIDVGLEKYICKWDGNVFYLISENKQPVYYLSNDFIEFIKPDETDSINHKNFKEEGCVEDEELSEKGKFFIDFLRKNELIGEFIPQKMGVYIKEWYNVLNNSGIYKIDTKSPMKSQSPHNNGFMCIEDGLLKLYACADKSFVFVYPILKEKIDG